MVVTFDYELSWIKKTWGASDNTLGCLWGIFRDDQLKQELGLWPNKKEEAS